MPPGTKALGCGRCSGPAAEAQSPPRRSFHFLLWALRDSAANPRILKLGLALLGVLVAFGTSPASDWPRWRGPEGNGISAEGDWKVQSLARPKVKWKLNVGA